MCALIYIYVCKHYSLVTRHNHFVRCTLFITFSYFSYKFIKIEMFSINELITFGSLLATTVALIYGYFLWVYLYWKKKGIPYVEPRVPFGSFKSTFSKTAVGVSGQVTEFYEKARKNNWKYVGVYNGGRPWLVVTNLDLIKNVMTKDFNNFTDRGVYFNEKHQPISGHLFALGGSRWRKMRVKLSPTFTSGKMKVMFETLAKCGTLLERNIDEISKNNEPVEIKNILACFSTDIIGSVAFGLECNTLKEKDSPFRTYSNKIFQPGFVRIFKIFFTETFPDLARSLGVVIFPKEVEKFFTDILTETVEYREKNKIKRKDFLQMLIDIKDNDGKSGDGLTLDEIVAQSFVFFVAGHETSSTTMSFALYELAVHQDIQDKVREEIHRVLKKHNGQVTYDALKEMEYLQQVIDETLRMYPAVPFLTRVAKEDYKAPDMDLVIEKGIKVIIPIRGIHYDESIYPNPTVFDPERFTQENRESRHQYAHIPFGEGPRICIGMRFGIMQSQMGMVSILKNHRVKISEKTSVPLKLNPKAFIPAVAGGIWLNVVPI